MKRLIALIIVLMAGNAYAGTPKPLQDIGITVNVTHNKDTGFYYYHYEVCNPATNPMADYGVLDHVAIDVSKKSGDANLLWAGLYFSDAIRLHGKLTTSYTSVTTEGILNQYRDQFTPIGIEQMPKESNNPISLTAKWTVNFIFWEKTNVMSPAFSVWPAEPAVGLLPGKCLDNFILASPALPAIRNAIGQSAYYISKEDIPEEETENPAYVPEFYDNIAWHGSTIAPKAPPANFVPVDFLNYVISLKQQSYQLGWIVQKNESEQDKDKSKEKPKKDKETGIMQSLDKKLNHAMTELQAGNTKQAINILSAFEGEVEGLYNVCREHEEHNGDEDSNDKDNKGKDKMHEQEITSLSKTDHNNQKHEHCNKSHLTSEAYALLKYNAEYLINELGGKIEKHDHEDHDTKKDKD